MFTLSANKSCLWVGDTELLVSGGQKIYHCNIDFSGDWAGLNAVVSFRAGSIERAGQRIGEYTWEIPWECLENHGKELEVSVTGTNDAGTVLPTMWASLGTIIEGGTVAGASREPTPELYAQILAAAENAEDIALSVREDADAGRFDGPPGEPGRTPVKGVDYFTETDKTEIVEEVEKEFPTVLPNPNALNFSGAVSGSYDGSAAKFVNIPTTMPNPKAITFTGAVSATYDGSSAVTVNIPIPVSDLIYDGSVNLTADETFASAVVANVPLISSGETYTVTWDGEPYTLTAAQFPLSGMPFPCLGNTNLFVSVGEDTGEPFLLVTYQDGAVNALGVIADSADIGTHTLKVARAGAQMEYIDLNALGVPVHTIGGGQSSVAVSAETMAEIRAKADEKGMLGLRFNVSFLGETMPITATGGYLNGMGVYQVHANVWYGGAVTLLTVGIGETNITITDTAMATSAEVDNKIANAGGGGGDNWEWIVDYTVPEGVNVGPITFTEDVNGNPFDLKKVIIFLVTKPTVDDGFSEERDIKCIFDKSWAEVGGAHSLWHANAMIGKTVTNTSTARATVSYIETIGPTYWGIRGTSQNSGSLAYGIHTFTGAIGIDPARGLSRLDVAGATEAKIDAFFIGSLASNFLGPGSTIKILGVRK